MAEKAVVLLSGGLDSATCLAVAKKEKFEIHALCFDYGQRHKIEIECSRRTAAAIGVAKFHLIRFDLRQWGASALTSDQLEVPEFQEHHDSVPITYVPARNMIFLSFGAALAEGIGARDIFIGVNSMDYSGYPDCRPAFIDAFRHEKLQHLGIVVGGREKLGVGGSDGLERGLAVDKGARGGALSASERIPGRRRHDHRHAAARQEPGERRPDA